MRKVITLIILSLLFISCGFDAQEERDQAILSANIQLSERNCNEAIKALQAVPFTWKDPTFLRTFSLAYACKGNFNVVTLFSDDLPLFGSVANSPLGGLSRFSTSSDMKSPTDTDYLNIFTGLNYLLYAGGIDSDEDPTPAKRDAVFELQEVQEMEMLAFYELLVNLGRFLYYFGNADEDGIKGDGLQSNKCFIVYDNLPLEGSAFFLRDYLDIGLTGSCSKARAADSGHEYLYNADDGSRNTEALCEGVVLINNFFELLPRVLSSIAGSDFDAIDDISGVLEIQLDVVENVKSGLREKVGEVLSYDLCVSNNQNDDTFLQFYYAFIAEVLFR